MKQLQKNLKKFQDNVLFNTEYDDLDIKSCFVDKRDGHHRVIILTGDLANEKKISKLVSPFFDDVRIKIVLSKQDPKLSFNLNTGTGIRHISHSGFGTLGGFITKHNNNRLYGLSNNHVIAALNNGRPGDPIFSDSNRQVGKLVDFIPLRPHPHVNRMDAAIFEIDPRAALRWNPHPPVGRPIGPRLHLKVYKQGISTEFTRGMIKAYKGAITIPIGRGNRRRNYHFVNVITIEGLPKNGKATEFSKKGDSGSLVFTPNHHLVGIIFAKLGRFSYALPIGEVAPLRR